MPFKRFTVTITTDASGDGIGYTPEFTGRISTIRYVKTDYTNGVDFTITLNVTGEGIWAEENVNASTSRAPRQATHSIAGVAALYAAAGQPVNDKIVAVADKVKIVVAQGGDTHTGTFHVTVE
jgi:hypothetical protein